MAGWRGVLAVVACGALLACGGRDAATPAVATGSASPVPAAAPASSETPAGGGATPAGAEQPAAVAAPPPGAPSAGTEASWAVDQALDVTWGFQGELVRRKDGEALVVSGAGLPEVRVLRRQTPAELGDAPGPVTGLGDRYFGPVWIRCTTEATGEAAAAAEAFCASLRPVEHAKAEILSCEAPSPHSDQLKAYLAELGPELLNCLRDAREFYPTLAGVEAGLQLRFTGDGIPVRVGHNADIGQLNASDSYDDCVYRIVKDLKYPNANGAAVDARCKLRLSLYEQPAPAGK
jgi:hypothetical protein